MMDRRRFLLASLAGTSAVPLVAEAQSASKVPRIGYLSGDTRTTASTFEDAFRQGLRELGYVGPAPTKLDRFGLEDGTRPALLYRDGGSR